ncbi:MAG: sugar phosphate isomerase/epimerase [Clostridiales bacterium]|jgi:sugar phosphate isomerase/epimerase|nr:sugar phosphate isomerase/epimerase [Clostridiales bacterium]
MKLNLGMSSASLFNILDTENSFDFFLRNKIKVCEVFLSTTFEYSQDFAKLLKDNKKGVTVHSVHSLGNSYEPELFSSNKRVKDDALTVFHKVCSVAQTINAKFLTFHGPLKLKRQAYHHNYQALAKDINFLCDLASDYNLYLSYENVHYSYFDSPLFFKNLSPLCPKLYATIDVKHAVQGGHDPIEFFKATQDRLSTVHICDVGLDNTPCLPFCGKVEFEFIFNYLVKTNCTAPVILELYPNTYKSENDLMCSFNSLYSLLQSTTGNIVKFKQQ